MQFVLGFLEFLLQEELLKSLSVLMHAAMLSSLTILLLLTINAETATILALLAMELLPKTVHSVLSIESIMISRPMSPLTPPRSKENVSLSVLRECLNTPNT